MRPRGSILQPSGRPTFTAIVALALIVLLAACGSTTTRPAHGNAAKTAASREATLVIGGFGYHPATLTVAAGTRVTVVNHDQTAHTATATGTPPAFDTGTVAPGHSTTITLTKPGSYNYFCQFHAFMRGTITVTQ